MEKFDVFKSSYELVDSNITYHELAGKTLSRGEDNDLMYDDIGILSNRALRNLSKYLSIPKGLLTSVTQGTLNTLVREQLARKNHKSFRMSVLDAQIIFLQPSEEIYLSYDRILKDLEERIAFTRGNPALDDVVRIFFKTGNFTPNDNHEMQVGYSLQMSPVCAKMPNITPMMYRQVCTNGLISDTKLGSYKLSVDASNEVLITDMVTSCAKRMDEVQEKFQDFVTKVSTYEVKVDSDKVFDDIFNTVSIPKKTLESARAHAEALRDDKDSLNHAGIDNLSTVWSYINLFTYVVQSLSSYAAIERTEESMYKWANSKLESEKI